MSNKQHRMQQIPHELSGLDRLGLRVSAMIGSPVAQIQRWVTIHRLDTDEDQAWDAVMSVLAETDGIEMSVNDDGTVTLKWETATDDDRVVEVDDLETVGEPVPF